jgi:hypothetical protein
VIILLICTTIASSFMLAAVVSFGLRSASLNRAGLRASVRVVRDFRIDSEPFFCNAAPAHCSIGQFLIGRASETGDSGRDSHQAVADIIARRRLPGMKIKTSPPSLSRA